MVLEVIYPKYLMKKVFYNKRTPAKESSTFVYLDLFEPHDPFTLSSLYTIVHGVDPNH